MITMISISNTKLCGGKILALYQRLNGFTLRRNFITSYCRLDVNGQNKELINT